MLPLLTQNPQKTLDVGVVELAKSRWRPLGMDETATLEEADLGDRHVRELGDEQIENLSNGEVGTASHARAPGWTGARKRLTRR